MAVLDKPPLTTLTIRIDKAVLDRLAIDARSKGRTRSTFAREVIQRFYEDLTAGDRRAGGCMT